MIEVKMGQFVVLDQPEVITTGGVGSCMVVCLHVSANKIGGLAHVMLPKRPNPAAPIDDSQHRYADVAIKLMVDQLIQLGASPAQITAKIVGGANMFPGIQGRSQKIGEKNIIAVKEVLGSLSISITAEETGGSHGRSVAFDLNTGIVTIKTTI